MCLDHNLWCLYPNLKGSAQFLLNPKSTYSISINTPSLMNPYLGTGPRAEVSSESHKCPYQSIIFSNLWSRIKTQETAKHFFTSQHPKQHLDSFLVYIVLGTVVAVTSNHCHVPGGALTHLCLSRQHQHPPAVLSTPRAAACSPLCLRSPTKTSLSLHTNIQDKCLSEMFRALGFLRIFC